METTTIDLERLHLRVRHLAVQQNHRFSLPPIRTQPAIAQWANMGGQGTIGCNFDFLYFFGFITTCYVYYEPNISLYIVFGPFTGI